MAASGRRSPSWTWRTGREGGRSSPAIQPNPPAAPFGRTTQSNHPIEPEKKSPLGGGGEHTCRRGQDKSVVVGSHQAALAGAHLFPGLVQGVALASVDGVDHLDGILEGVAVTLEGHHQLGEVLFAESVGDQVGLLVQLNAVHFSILKQGHHWPFRVAFLVPWLLMSGQIRARYCNCEAYKLGKTFAAGARIGRLRNARL